MAKVVSLHRRKALQDREKSEAFVAELGRLPPDLLTSDTRARVLRELRRSLDARNNEPTWPGGFFMFSRVQAVAVWEAIHTLPNIGRRNQVHRAFDFISAFVERETNEVLLSRDELARKIGTAPCHVSRIMATLQQLGVIARTERRRVPGVRGPGEVVYFVNPHVAWNGRLEVRKQAAEKVEPPLLKLINGGAAGPSK